MLAAEPFGNFTRPFTKCIRKLFFRQTTFLHQFINPI